ncbi:ribulose-phosphate 3-epimerase [Chlamydiota bacterium]
MQVVPAVLTEKKDDLKTMVNGAETYTNYIQIDIMDGIFVPSKSITARELHELNSSINWEMHLMIQDPEKTINEFIQKPVRQIIFHIEATNCVSTLFDILEKASIRKGLAINPDSDISLLEPFLKTVDAVLFLTVYPGFYGRPMVPHVLQKAKQFKRDNPHLSVGVDGGIKEDNLHKISETGVDFVCVGSAIFKSDNPAESFKRMQKKVQ